MPCREVRIMAQRGRKPKPTAMKVLEGNPGKRSLNTTEPQPPKRAPRCPNWHYNHQLYHILHDEPNPEMTSFVFRYLVLDEYKTELLCG